MAPDVLSVSQQLEIVSAWLALDQINPSEKLARGLVESRRNATVVAGTAPDWVAETSAAEIALGDALLRNEKPDDARALYENALTTRLGIVATFGETADLCVTF